MPGLQANPPAAPDSGAVLTCTAFVRPEPQERRTWRIRLGSFGALALCDHPRDRLAFGPDAFDDPRLEAMTWAWG